MKMMRTMDDGYEYRKLTLREVKEFVAEYNDSENDANVSITYKDGTMWISGCDVAPIKTTGIKCAIIDYDGWACDTYGKIEIREWDEEGIHFHEAVEVA